MKIRLCYGRSWKLIGAMALVSWAVQGQSCNVTFSQGQDLGSIVASHPSGTTFCFNPGTYREQSIIPKSNDVFIGSPAVILNGSQLVTGFTQQGSYYVATVPLLSSKRSGLTAPGWSGSQYPNDLFWNNVALRRVLSLSQVMSGTWYASNGTTNSTIYIVDNPSGQQVELSYTPYAFDGNAEYGAGSNVTIQGLTIEKYASSYGQASIIAGSGWLIENNEIRLNHICGIRTEGTIQNNYVHHNGAIGLDGGGNNMVLDGNEVAYNNTLHFVGGAGSEVGGIKISLASYCTVSNNYVHDNAGQGVHDDGQTYQNVFQSNRLVNNVAAGFQHEISYDAIFRYNVVQNTQAPSGGSSLYWGADIWNLASTNMTVYGNTVISSFNGIGAYAAYRTDTSQYAVNRGPLETENFYVHDNVVVQSAGTAAGIVAAPQHNPSAFTSLNNRFVNNIYHLSLPGGVMYVWQPGAQTQPQWLSDGEDTTGTWITTSPYPSNAFAMGEQVTTSGGVQVWSLPSNTDSASILVATLPSGAKGTVTKVCGPIYSNDSWWWQVSFTGGQTGWVMEADLTI